MVYRVIQAGGLFTNSPEIHIRRHPAIDDTVNDAMEWIKQRAEKGGQMNCQVRPSSDEERDGHLARLIGVRKMDAMLRELKDKTTYWLDYDEEVSPCSFPYMEVQSSLRYDCRRNNGVLRMTSIHATSLHSAISGG